MRRAARMASMLAAAWTVMVQAALAQGAAPRYAHWWLPARATAEAGRIDGIFYLILWITLGALLLVFLLLSYILIRFRRRDGGRARHIAGNARLEAAWTAIPLLILLFLAFVSYRVWSEITTDAPGEAESLVIEVAPRQFQWDIRYPGRDGRFGTADDVLTYDDLHVPAGRNVLIRLKAQDVIHSFFVPEFRIKQDAVPGMVTRVRFNVPKPGKFEIACAELCGAGHYRMRGRLTVHDRAGYDAWYAEASAKFAAAAAPATNDSSPKDSSPTNSSAKDSASAAVGKGH